MVWFWYFTICSGAGFLLEQGYARATGGRRDRKRTLLLPLCPVYGLGACCILLAAAPFQHRPAAAALLAAAAATGAEYLTALFYEKVLGVVFWDYSGRRGNLRGRVCPFFSAAWGLLSLPLLYWLQPVLRLWAEGIPPAVTAACAAAVGGDLLISAWMLRLTGSRDCLRWYQKR